MYFFYYMIIAICAFVLLCGFYLITHLDKIHSKKNPNATKTEKIISALLMIGVAIGGISWAWNSVSTNKSAASVEQVVKDQEEDDSKVVDSAAGEEKKAVINEIEKKQDGYIKIIMAATNLDKYAAQNVYDAFQSVGINDLKSMMLVDEETSSYTWEASEIPKGAVGLIDISNGKVAKIIDKNVVLYEDGKVLKNISVGTMSQNDYELGESYAKKAVREYLKDPDSAEFDEGQFYYAKNDNVIEITGKVKAKNSFNAYVVNKFLVVVDLKNNTYNLKGFE